MSKINNGALDQYGAEPFEQQQSGTACVERVKSTLFLVDKAASHSMVQSHPALLIHSFLRPERSTNHVLLYYIASQCP